jgi:transcriptional regulator with XRE-family HTH domain
MDSIPVLDPQEPDVAKIVLRRDQLAKLRKLKNGGLNTDAAFAEAIGVNPGQVSRVLRGDSAPGAKFIAGVLDVFGVEFFTDLFAVVPDDANDGAAA